MTTQHLKYHQAIYDLLTQTRINPEYAFDEQYVNDELFIRYRDDKEKARRERAVFREKVLAWTKLELYQRPVQFSEANIQKLDALEQKYSIKFPAAVREWYSLDIAPEMMAIGKYEPIPIDEIQPLAEMLPTSWMPRPKDNLWFFLYAEYIGLGIEGICFEMDGSDDPPVFTRYYQQLIPLSSTFSEFIYIHFWDWHANYTFEYGIKYGPQQTIAASKKVWRQPALHPHSLRIGSSKPKVLP